MNIQDTAGMDFWGSWGRCLGELQVPAAVAAQHLPMDEGGGGTYMRESGKLFLLSQKGRTSVRKRGSKTRYNVAT